VPALVPRDGLSLTAERDERPRRFGALESRRFGQPSVASLDGLINRTWSRLVATGTAECPICAGELRAGCPCASCGSDLS